MAAMLFPGLDISIDKGKYIYEMFDKRMLLTLILLECHQLQVTYHISFSIVQLCQNL